VLYSQGGSELVKEIDFPVESLLYGKKAEFFYRDSYKLISHKVGFDAKHIFHGIFGHLPKTAQWLMALRNSIMKWFGFSVGDFEPNLLLENIKEGENAGFLFIESVTSKEVVSASYEKNMDFSIKNFRI
tara:strand:- start:13491 stop:13877 length:387 start_codon:yes stop_codon:yes gene_type:complete